MRTTSLVLSVLTSIALAESNKKVVVTPISIDNVADSHLEHGHRHQHRDIHHHQEKNDSNDEPLNKRGGQCQFPTDAGLVAVTPDQQNAGWAMSPDQPCQPGGWCPYACPPGQLSGQWDPSVTTYSYPGSQYGGLQCQQDGTMVKPFPNKPYCYDGTGTVQVRNTCSQQVAFCQTVLPGNEAMLIPTNVGAGSTETIAVPDPTYWASTAAHYYVNPPGVSTDTGCVWGSSDNPYGNWVPFVAGANTDSNGNTFVKIGWNPIYLQSSTPFRNTLPSYGVRIVCDGTCNGTPCEIDPSKVGINGVTSNESADGAGDGAFCVVTASKGSTAFIEVFEIGSGSGSSGSSGQSSPAASSPAAAPSSSSAPPPPPPSTSAEPTTSSSSSSTTSSSSTQAPSVASTTAESSTQVPSTSSEAPHPTALDLEALNATESSTTAAKTFKVGFDSNLYLTSRTALYNVAQANVTSSASEAGSTSVVAATSSVHTTSSSHGAAVQAAVIPQSFLMALIPALYALL